LDSSSEYTTLYAGGNRLTDCKSGTTQWATPSQCSNVDVTQYVSSSGSLALRLDATSAVDVDGGPLNTHLGAKFSLQVTGSSTSGKGTTPESGTTPAPKLCAGGRTAGFRGSPGFRRMLDADKIKNGKTPSDVVDDNAGKIPCIIDIRCNNQGIYQEYTGK
jgi:hypothetical protein